MQAHIAALGDWMEGDDERLDAAEKAADAAAMTYITAAYGLRVGDFIEVQYPTDKRPRVFCITGGSGHSNHGRVTEPPPFNLHTRALLKSGRWAARSDVFWNIERAADYWKPIPPPAKVPTDPPP